MIPIFASCGITCSANAFVDEDLTDANDDTGVDDEDNNEDNDDEDDENGLEVEEFATFSLLLENFILLDLEKFCQNPVDFGGGGVICELPLGFKLENVGEGCWAFVLSFGLNSFVSFLALLAIAFPILSFTPSTDSQSEFSKDWLGVDIASLIFSGLVF